ncbi:hypothetical protein [Actinokineospora sp. NPDC004072]
MELWLPPGVECPHPSGALLWSFGSRPAPRLAVLCQRCCAAWDERSVPGVVIDRLRVLLDEGRYVRVDGREPLG